LFGEFFGTFFLVVVAAGAGVVSAVSQGSVGRDAAVVAPGLMVMAIILFMGAVSGAHLNPAVSIGFAARGDFPWKRVPGYIGAQLLGATVACAFLWAMFGKVGMMGATEPGAGVSDLQAMFMELLLTLGLVSVILGTASKAQNVGPVAALAVGGVHRARGPLGEPDQRRIDEPGSILRTRLDTPELRSLLGLCGRSDRRRVLGGRGGLPASGSRGGPPGDPSGPRPTGGVPSASSKARAGRARTYAARDVAIGGPSRRFLARS
jgi:hypothetical protein